MFYGIKASIKNCSIDIRRTVLHTVLEGREFKKEKKLLLIQNNVP